MNEETCWNYFKSWGEKLWERFSKYTMIFIEINTILESFDDLLTDNRLQVRLGTRNTDFRLTF